MRYEPRDPPEGVDDDLASYLRQEFAQIAESFFGVEEVLLVELNVAPDKPRDGMVVLADGVNFNPGAGAGFYGRRGGAWVFLG